MQTACKNISRNKPKMLFICKQIRIILKPWLAFLDSSNKSQLTLKGRKFMTVVFTTTKY